MTPTDVSLFVTPRAPLPQTDRTLLGACVARVCNLDPSAVTIVQRCERCGGSHGRPRVLAPPGVFVSLSRAGSVVVVAVSLVGPIGVDIESIAAVGRAGFDDVAFTAVERAGLAALPARDRDRVRATLWTTKEALLKVSGTGLTVDPREVTVWLGGAGASAGTGASAQAEDSAGAGASAGAESSARAEGSAGAGASALLSWPTATLDLTQVHVARFDAGPGLVGTLAMLGSAAPSVSVR